MSKSITNNLKIKSSTITVRIAEDAKFIATRMFAHAEFKEAILPDTVEEFYYTCFYGCKGIINIPTGLKKIGNKALANYNGLKELDFSNCKNLVSIGEEAFLSSNADYIIFSDSVTEIGDYALKKAGELKFIYLPSSITSIGRGCFSSMGSSIPLGTTVYTYKDSYAEKYSKKNKFRIVHVDSVDDVYRLEKLSTTREVSQAKLSKLNLLLSSDPLHNILLNEEYVDRALELYTLYGKCTQECKITEVELDKRNLVSIPFDTVFNAYEKKSILELNSGETLQNQSEFNCYVNFITKFTPNLSQALSKTCLDFLRIDGNMIDESIGLRIKCRYKSSMLLHFKAVIDKKSAIIAMVIIDNNIVYLTLLTGTKINRITDIEFVSNTGNTEAVEGYLSKETAYSFKDSYLTLDIPKYIGLEITKCLNRQLTVVGAQVIKHNKFNTNLGLAKVYMLSNTSGKIIEANIRYSNSGEDSKISNDKINYLGITNIYNLNEMPKEAEQIIMDSAFIKDDSIAPVLTRMVYTEEEYINKLKNQNGAYDEPEACIEWELSKIIQESGVKELTELSSTAFELIFSTPFFIKTQKKYEEISRGRLSNKIDIENGAYTIKTYIYNGTRLQTNKLIGNSINFLSVLIDNSKAIPSSVVCYASTSTIDTIFNSLSSIVDREVKSEYYVDNTAQKISDYYLIGDETIIKITDSGHYGLQLGINKASGIVFLLILDNNTRYKLAYKIFRYRSLAEAVEKSDWVGSHEVNGGTTGMLDCTNLYYKAYDLLDNIRGNYKEANNAIKSVRDMVMNGYPNGYALSEIKKYLFDSVAKQRKMT